MPDATLALRLAGPMQSWGTRSRFDHRDTGLEPSKSAVLGLCAAALGRPRGAPMDDLNALEMAVRVDWQGLVATDFHTVEGVPTADGKSKTYTLVSRREYLADAVFLAALGGPAELVQRLADAFRAPVWQLALGRKAFPPSQPLVLEISDRPVPELVKEYPWLVSSRRTRASVSSRLEQGEAIKLRVVSDSVPDEASWWTNDRPLSFEPRRFQRRPVARWWVPLTQALLDEEVLKWRST